jgi:small subunit ribosomal protein S4
VRAGDEIRVRPGSREVPLIQSSLEAAKSREGMSWLSLDAEKLSGRLLEYPTRGNIPTKVSEQLIVELYSK